MAHGWMRLAGSALAAVLVLGACDEAAESGAGDAPTGGGGEGGLEAVVADIQAFWAEAAPAFSGVEFTPLPDDSVGGTGDELPFCDGVQVPAEEVEGNAFAVGCSEGVVVAYDDLGIFAPLEEKYGPVGPAVVMAHEFGHVAQFQAGIEAPTVLMEQQADCLAGAWSADAYDRNVAPFDTDEALDGTIGALLDFRDEPGTDAEHGDAHGLGFDRVAAYQEGFESGVEGCATYLEDPPVLTEVPFSSEEEAATGGQMPIDELFPLVEEELNRVFGDVFGLEALSVDSLPPDSIEALIAEHEYAGDGAAVALLAANWSAAVRGASGLPVENPEDILPLACGAGAWTGAILDDPEASISPSPGDLDEAIIGLADLVWDAEGGPGLTFDAVAQYRLGISDGFEACELT